MPRAIGHGLIAVSAMGGIGRYPSAIGGTVYVMNSDAALGGMLDALGARGPHPDHAGKLMLFGRFVGAWDVDGTLIAADGSRSRHRGEWLFGWVLEGRAIQDVLISPPRGASGERLEYGSTLRFYDPGQDAWQISWVTPPQRAVRRLVARPSEGGIVLEGQELSGRHLRWTFSDITGDSFTWRGFFSDDGGTSWTQDEEMLCRRRVTPG